MKIILPILVIGILILSGLGAVAQNIMQEKMNTNTKTEVNERATHTVFGEYGTATWCGYCKFAHGALKELYSEGILDFYYISLVTDKNTKANSRCVSDYNAYGWPTLWWDGGYRVDVGASSVAGAKATYTTSINNCGNVAVEDVDVVLKAVWLGGTEMKIDVSVKNNEGGVYGGTIRVYITEKVTSMGWIDSGGQPYTFPFLDWAFNEPISISAGSTWSDSMTWDGTSNGFPTVTQDNIMVIAAVFNDELNQGYSYPPSSNPFNAYYVDDTVAAEPANHAPSITSITGPTSGDLGVSYEFTFTTTDEDEDDVYYWIDWGDNTNSGWLGPYASGSPAFEDHIYTSNGIYYIKAKAKDINGAEGSWSNLYKFIVGNLAPNKPTISGPTNGKIKTSLEYTFTAYDQNGDNLLYYIRWGDGKTEEWIGPYDSGAEFKLSHSWNKEGNWVVEAKVKDPAGMESDWTRLNINIPKTRQSFDFLFTHIFERYPMLNRLIENLFDY